MSIEETNSATKPGKLVLKAERDKKYPEKDYVKVKLPDGTTRKLHQLRDPEDRELIDRTEEWHRTASDRTSLTHRAVAEWLARRASPDEAPGSNPYGSVFTDAPRATRPKPPAASVSSAASPAEEPPLHPVFALMNRLEALRQQFPDDWEAALRGLQAVHAADRRMPPPQTEADPEEERSEADAEQD